MATRLTLARVGAAVLGAAALALSALPAAAADGASVTANPAPQADKYGGHVWLAGHHGSTLTALLALRPTDGSPMIYTYCVDINADEGGSNVTMSQTGWNNYPDQSAPFAQNSGKINWMLHHSFPMLGISDLESASGTKGLTGQEAVEGTQAAIWHESDGVSLDTKNPRNDANVTKLYTYLVNSATDLPQPPANPTLTITAPSNTSAVAGDKIGPFVVHTNLSHVTLTSTAPTGVTLSLVDAAGKAVDSQNVTDGTKVYFETKSGIKAGTASFTVASDQQIGQLFVGPDVTSAAGKPGGVRQNCRKPKYQSLIVAQSTSISKTGSVSWTVASTTTTTTTSPATTTTSGAAAAPSTTATAPGVVNTAGSSPLPFTGVNVIAPVVLAVVLIGAGAAFLLLQRRRRRA